MNTTPTSNNPTGLIEQASNLFMTLQVGIGTWKGTILNREAAKAAAEAANVESREAGRLYVDILGPHHSHLKAVIARFTAIRTYIYEVSQPLADGPGQKRGDLLVPTSQVPTVLATLKRLKAEAFSELETFLAGYDIWAEDAKLRLGDWVAGKHYPTPDEIRRRFYVEVRPPMPLQIADASKINLPAGLAEEIAAQSVNRVTRQLESAKQATVEAAEEHFARLVKQLTHGERLHQSLINAAKQHAVFLGELGTALGDPRLTLIADEVKAKVLNVSDTRQWREFGSRRDAAAKAASKVHKDLRGLRNEAEAAKAAPAPANPSSKDDGLMVDLW